MTTPEAITRLTAEYDREARERGEPTLAEIGKAHERHRAEQRAYWAAAEPGDILEDLRRFYDDAVHELTRGSK